MKDPGTAPPSRPWYREPMVWLVIAIPFAAVIGGLVTLGLAIRGGDALVTTAEPDTGTAR
ncbi:MAG: hypothetical protein EPO25_09960 [Gammaproteobacteria bacterium]|nr:MAG: hypothetical protein EPO25_09960 [Gammaproteobacteria bacterium]